MKEYDAITLGKVKAVEMEIYRDFKALCDRHQLRFFGFAGTGIGAVRHQGFIPWDDDIDVGLPRKDYDLFLKYAKEELSEKYYVLNTEEDPNYPLMTTRLCRKGTVFREYAMKDIDCKFGIFLDIYPFDNISDDKHMRKKQARRGFLFSKLLILRSIPYPVLPFRGWKGKLAHCCTAAAHFLLKLFRVSPSWIYRKCRESGAMCTDENSRQIGFLWDTFPMTSNMDRSEVFPLQELAFEDTTMTFPNALDAQLRRAYGDYMQLPPVEKRKNHYPYQLEFCDEVEADLT